MKYNETFLRELDRERNRIVYARITSLKMDESPIETIEGRVTQGSVNIDGNSAVRRSCSLTMVAPEDKVEIHNYYWGYKTKFKLSIGLRNLINPNYPDIIWFDQGIFVITQFNCALATNNYTISLQGKDKMCLLNGEVGGTINAPTQFDCIEEESADGTWKITKFPIRDIIRDAVHQYANEPFHNIVINDIDDMGLELLEYRFDDPMFLFRYSNEDTYFNGVFNSDMPCWLVSNNSKSTIGAKDKQGEYIHTYDSLVSSLTEIDEPTEVYLIDPDIEKSSPVCIAKVEYGNTAGYRLTELIYPDDLILNVGEALTAMLDKLKNMLGNFEYFYDIDGRFIFQRKKNYINTVWTPIVEVEDGDSYIDGIAYSDSSSYTFSGSELITAFNNSPNLNNLRNDYSVWGVRKGVDGADIPIHMRYAIDEKPVYYKTYDGAVVTNDQYDWRELIYQMQKDYRKHNHDNDFALKISQNNPDYYPTGQTGYEPYYIDIEGFWRQLYYTPAAYEETVAKKQARIDYISEEMTIANSNKDETALSQLEMQKKSLIQDLERFQQEYEENYYPAVDEDGNNHPRRFWNKAVYESPELLNYWFDFLDSDGELNNYSVKMVGSRPKSVNDTSVKSIYFRDTPAIIFATAEEMEGRELNTGYRYFQTAGLENMFSISTQGKSAKEEIDSLLYNHSYAIESVTITAVPVYYLEPNTRIYVYDNKTGIEGDYIISKMTIPLAYNGMMTINATKAPEILL